MKNWKKTMAAALCSVLVLSQGAAYLAAEAPEGGAGTDVVAEEPDNGKTSEAAGLGIGAMTPAGGIGKQAGISGTIGMGAATDLGSFGTEAGSGAESEDVDTNVLENIQLELRIRGSYILMNAEDDNFYCIYTWGEKGIPDIMVGRFDWNTTEGFYDQYTDYMRQSRPELTVAEEPAAMTIGDKQLVKIVYNYTVQGYIVRDTRYIWLAPNDSLYMFTKREIPDLNYLLGDTLESNIIPGASVMGAQSQEPAPAPQPETTAPSAGGAELYVQNEDSSWTVTTKYYTMTIPPAWTGHFDAAILEQENQGYNLKVVNKESADADFGGHLFTVMLIPKSEDYTYLPSYDYLGTMDTPEGTFSVVIQYPTDVQTGDIWQEFYKILNGDKNTAIKSIRPVSGVTWTLPDGSSISGSEISTPETTAPQPETTAPSADGDVLGISSGTGYSNRLFALNFQAPSGWIMANQDQLVTLNQNLPADQFLSNIEAGVPVCVAYAQNATGTEIMNVVVENGKTYLDDSVQVLTQEDVKAILEEARGISSSSLESLGAAVTSAAVNTVTCMGQTCYSLDITFDYGEFSGTQKQIGIPAGTYLAMITVRSVSGDNTQATLDMFSAA